MSNSFMKALSSLSEACANNRDATVSLTDLVEGYVGGDKFSTEDGEFRLTPKGFRQLGDHIGFSHKALLRLNDDPGLQKTVLRHVVSEKSDDTINLRVTGERITHVLSSDHVLLKNLDIMGDVYGMIGDGRLPPIEQIEMGPLHIGRDGREFSMRIMAPEVWNYNVGNGKPDIVYGALVIGNDEKGQGSFRSGGAISRMACFNWTIGEFKMQVNHRYATKADFDMALNTTVSLIDQYSSEIADAVRATRDHRLQRPELIFEKVAQRLGIPGYAMTVGREYFDQETDSNSMFDVVQAVTRASQVISNPGGRKKPRWGLRETVEQNIMTVAQEVATQGEDAFVTTVADIIGDLSQYNPDTEAQGFDIAQRETRGREVIINQ